MHFVTSASAWSIVHNLGNIWFFFFLLEAAAVDRRLTASTAWFSQHFATCVVVFLVLDLLLAAIDFESIQLKVTRPIETIRKSRESIQVRMIYNISIGFGRLVLSPRHEQKKKNYIEILLLFQMALGARRYYIQNSNHDRIITRVSIFSVVLKFIKQKKFRRFPSWIGCLYYLRVVYIT